MMSSELIDTLEKLPEPLQQEVLHYAEFLAHNYVKTHPDKTSQTRPGFGSWQGQIIMAEDFDAPLEDMKEYME
ncbi:MAG: DUF2281 domain-containing protein [Acaryochloridaceae cyanobacterium RU_4_10]|nr:DUF2281 domain-containing protein [Acaryochloridaceae cyanobacterium RU_4_10]